MLDTVNGSVRKGVQPGKPDAEMITPAAAQCSHLNEAGFEGFFVNHFIEQRVGQRRGVPDAGSFHLAIWPGRLVREDAAREPVLV